MRVVVRVVNREWCRRFREGRRASVLGYLERVELHQRPCRKSLESAEELRREERKESREHAVSETVETKRDQGRETTADL